MPDRTKKAKCPAPSAIVAACRRRAGDLHAWTPSAGYAQIISEGIGLLARASEAAPKLVDLCHRKYPRFDQAISTYISPAVREQARQMKRARAFASFQDIYLEAVLADLVDRGVLTAGLDAKPGESEPPEPAAAPRRAA
jgi:hypothetical protein